ncbi:uncharacterized protein [Hemitrygon akajei]|uniref:uncharacterized protein n=1 Tax=Hemitrygon akajei TaxID=2704970 RepID=UPI003BF9A872
MASKEQAESLTEEVICPVCLDFFTEPVTLDCGHNFCRSCITRCWERQEKICPECREEIADRTLRVNRALANLSEKTRKLNLNPKEKGSKRYCEEHGEELKLFCETDETLICLICATAREHKSHSFMLVNEAVQVYKGRVKSSFDSLTKSKADFAEMEQQQKEKISVVRKQKRTTTLKTARVGKERGPTIKMEHGTQVGSLPGEVPEQETATTSTASKKKQQELHMREEAGMRKQKQTKLQVPAVIESESGTELESDSLENTDEEKEEEEEPEEFKTGRLPGAKRKILRQITHEIKAIKETKTDIKNMKIRLDKVVEKQKKAAKKVKKLEEKTGDTIERVDKMEDNILTWTSESKRLLEKVDVLENFNREKNIKIVGLKEGIEGEDPIKFFQKWIPETLEMEEGSQLIEIEWAHRALRPKPQQDQNPRSILIKCLRYQDKERILKAAAQGARKRNGPLMIEGKRVLFYPDISYDLLKRRKEFNPVKKVLWEKGYQFILRYPATLMILLDDEERRFFTDHWKAEEFVQGLPNIR